MASPRFKIHISSINFAPDHAGIGVYSTDFPVYLAEQMHDVTMITGFSYYPRWKKTKEDGKRLFATEVYRNVRVVRGYLYVPGRVTALRRLLHEASFCLFATINFIRLGRPDAIVIFSPPFLLGFVAWLAARCWRCPLVINIQDLPLDAAMALGMVKPSFVSRLLLVMEGWIYRRADQVVTISESMCEKVGAKGVKASRLCLIPNWVDFREYQQTSQGRFLPSQPQAKGKFTVAYAGNLGIKQGVDVLIRIAKRVEKENGFHFFIIGDGSDRSRLEALASEMNLNNLTFLPFMAPAAYRDMLADVDVIFVAQRGGAGDNFFPSKLLGLMAAQKALLVAADGDSELSRAIVAGGFGLVCGYEDLDALERNLKLYANGKVSVSETGRRGMAVARSFDRAVILKDWENRLIELIKAKIST